VIEHPLLNELAEAKVVPIVGLAWKDQPDNSIAWLRKYGNPYAVVVTDREGKVAIDWGVYGAPETFLVGPDGTVLYKHIAPLTPAVWETEFLPRIRALAAPAGTGG
jgi:cytochrome c biogenesis protein CcmG/thiol:disulfide interchange protein DsbE